MGDNPDELVRRAHSKLTPGFLGKMFSSKESRQEEAMELLGNAANMYKIRKDWKKAGETYEEIARLEVESGGNTAYSHYQNAAHCFSFVDKVRANQDLDRAIESCVTAGKYMQAGKTAQKIATDFEENFDYPNAIDKYKKAAEYFAMESQNTKSLQQQCLLKVADLMCISNHKDMFTEAPKIYEKLGMQYLTVPLLKSSAKDMFFKNVICYVAKKDEVTAEVNLKKFLLEDPTFDDTRDSKFLKAVIKCITDPVDPDGFKKEVQIYKTVRELDKWKLNMFAMAVKNIEKDDMEDIL
jgi:tetratricopeptide (TPR) repeat protein